MMNKTNLGVRYSNGNNAGAVNGLDVGGILGHLFKHLHIILFQIDQIIECYFGRHHNTSVGHTNEHK